jgi:hypothetical protein
MVFAEGHKHTMALDQSALLEVLDALKAAEVDDRIPQAAETIYQALIEAELSAVIGALPHERTAAANLEHIRRHKRLISDHRGHLDRHIIGRIVHRVAARPGFLASTRTGCGTPWPPKRSTAACGWKPSPPCSATRSWR